MRSEGNDSDAATEQLNSRGQSDNGDDARPRRRGGGGGAGLSAQDLLRREGRL
jgi:RND superfamily putative drug exporter